MNMYEKAICDLTKALNVHTMYRERSKQQIEWCSQRGRPLKGMRNFEEPLDNLVFRIPVFNHLKDLEKRFGVDNYKNPLLDNYMSHIWKALDIYREDPQLERKEVRIHLAKALKEGRRINQFLNDTTYSFDSKSD